MIEDCKKGLIDMIFTKSISRFARNTVDCLNYIRMLKEMNIPVFFEKESINTMDSKGEVLLTIMASLAQQESESLSQNVKIGVQYRFQQGKVMVNARRFLGYRYADSPYFAITLMSVAVDDGAVQLYDLANGDRVPEGILSALVDESVVKRAFNVNFERVCLSRYLREEYPQIFRSYNINEDTVGDYLSPVGWQCTMIHCRTLGLPSTLASAGAALTRRESDDSQNH